MEAMTPARLSKTVLMQDARDDVLSLSGLSISPIGNPAATAEDLAAYQKAARNAADYQEWAYHAGMSVSYIDDDEANNLYESYKAILREALAATVEFDEPAKV